MKWKPRFTLRALLILVAICAGGVWLYSYRLPPRELRQIEIGMTREQVKEFLGEPTSEETTSRVIGFWPLQFESSEGSGHRLNYKRDWGWCEFTFDSDDRLFWYQYGYQKDELATHYLVTEKGRFRVN
jgi:hypothetical protein